jgi:site-specific DNA-cytosine methylase
MKTQYILNPTSEGISSTITTRYGAIAPANILGGHYPMSAVIEHDDDMAELEIKKYDKKIENNTRDDEENVKYRIRKLTPRECYRLMGVDDESIDKLLSTDIAKTNHYVLAGNSIVVDNLYYIFRNLLIDEYKGTDKEGTQLSLF